MKSQKGRLDKNTAWILIYNKNVVSTRGIKTKSLHSHAAVLEAGMRLISIHKVIEIGGVGIRTPDPSNQKRTLNALGYRATYTRCYEVGVLL